MASFNETYQGYADTLNNLRSQCTDAEKGVIIAETNLKSFQERKEKLITDCEAFMGVSMKDVPALLDSKKEELDKIMAKLDGIDIEGEVTEDTLKHIEEIIKEHNIVGQQEE